MRIVETKVYKFEELSDEAKEKAREWYREAGTYDEWWDSTFDGFVEAADILGLEVGFSKVPLMGGGTGKRYHIYFSGFSSQGDGACFEGRYAYAKGALKKLQKEFPESKELHQIAKSLQDLQKRNFYQVWLRVEHRGHYNHSGCMRFTVYRNDDKEVVAEDDFVSVMRELADYLYSCLESEYNYLNSDEVVDESLTINEYEFTEEGERA